MKIESKEDFREALKAISSMIHKIAKAQEHFAKGTPQHTLAKNRLKALRIASSLIRKASTEID
jgi:hypothetical protein